MNSIPFFVLAALPLLAFAMPTATTTKYLGCDILKYSQTAYTVEDDNLVGPDSYYEIPTFEECLDECFRTTGCQAVNFNDGSCFLYSNGLGDPSALDRNSYAPSSTVDHAYIKCPDLTATGPVGCGKQHDNYKPNITKITRIIGGGEAKPHSWPWQVKLITVIETFENGTSLISGCGASLVRVNPNREESDILITAGHCVCKGESINSTTPKQYDPDQMTVKAGTHDLKAPFELGQQVRKAAEIRKHPDYSWITINDIAIVKLDKPIKFSDTIRPICLADATEEIPAGKFCAAAGWGRDMKYNVVSSSNVLKQLALPVHSAETCGSDKVWNTEYNAEQMICAGDLLGNEGVCEGDSGGMLACQQTNTYDPNGGWKLYGAASFVSSEIKEIVTCLVKDKPGVFARVSKYRQWIDDNIKNMTSVN